MTVYALVWIVTLLLPFALLGLLALFDWLDDLDSSHWDGEVDDEPQYPTPSI
jgi:hypothetical protein